jgi:hypothetical protein
MRKLVTRASGAFAIAVSLSGCVSSGLPTNQTSALGAASGLLIADARDSSALEATALVLVGSVIGQQFGNPCVTTQSGRVTETIRNGRISTAQSQSTAYRCTTVGAPTSARSPSFQ